MPQRAARREDTNFAPRPRSVPTGFSRGQDLSTRRPAHGFALPQVAPLDRERLAAPRALVVERGSAPTRFSSIRIVEGIHLTARHAVAPSSTSRTQRRIFKYSSGPNPFMSWAAMP